MIQDNVALYCYVNGNGVLEMINKSSKNKNNGLFHVINESKKFSNNGIKREIKK